MHFSYITLLSALAIGLVIGGMAMVPSVRAKALLYVFPIPISIGIITTHGIITSSNLVGLALIWVFLWTTHVLAKNLQLPIIVADILAALLYICLGYGCNKLLHVHFAVAMLVFIGLWGLYILWIRRHNIAETDARRSTISPATKGGIAAILSFCIYSVQHVLAGIVVTFPYNGIFAVVEAQHNLLLFTRTVIRNTFGIAALFSSMYYLQAHLPLAINLTVGWMAFGAVLYVVQKISV